MDLEELPGAAKYLEPLPLRANLSKKLNPIMLKLRFGGVDVWRIMIVMGNLSLDSRILIVDDFVTVRMMLRSFLRELGYANVEEAENGRKALILLADAHDAGRPYSLVFSDINMPEIDGFELLQIIRSDDRFKKIVFIMVTAEAERDKVSKAAMGGVSGYIVKPFSAVTIKQKILELAGRTGA